MQELLHLQRHLDAKPTDLEGRSRRENIRIHGVKKGVFPVDDGVCGALAAGGTGAPGRICTTSGKSSPRLDA